MTVQSPPLLLFAAGVIVGQQTADRETKKHYIVDASEADAEFIRQTKLNFDPTIITASVRGYTAHAYPNQLELNYAKSIESKQNQ